MAGSGKMYVQGTEVCGITANMYWYINVDLNDNLNVQTCFYCIAQENGPINGWKHIS